MIELSGIDIGQYMTIATSLLAMVEFGLLMIVWKPLINKLRMIKYKGRIIKVEFFTPSRTRKMMYLTQDQLGILRARSGDPYLTDKQFFFMDEDDAIPSLVYREDSPSPIDPLTGAASKIDPSIIEGLIYRVQTYAKKKSLAGDKYQFYIMIISAITLVAVIVGLYVVYTQDTKILQSIASVGGAAVDAGRQVTMR